ncbi:MAG: hypothetical protein FWF31_00855 [Desulfobulbus sp.]|nr:hypothetical protein [Desulfobulbus sp.]
MTTLTHEPALIAQKIARYAEELGVTVERHVSGGSERVYLTLWHALVLSQPLRIRLSEHAASPVAMKKHGLADFEIGSHSVRCRDMAECLRWLRGITGRELPPKLSVSMQHDLRQSNSQALVTLNHFLQRSRICPAATARLPERRRQTGEPVYPRHEMASVPLDGGANEKATFVKTDQSGQVSCLGLAYARRQAAAGFTLLRAGAKRQAHGHADLQDSHFKSAAFRRGGVPYGHCTDNEAESNQWDELEKIWPQKRFADSMRVSWEKIFDPYVHAIQRGAAHGAANMSKPVSGFWSAPLCLRKDGL